MTDPKKPALDDLLANFALGPAWARGQEERQGKRPAFNKDREPRERRERHSGERNRDDKFGKGRRPFRKEDKFGSRRDEGSSGHRQDTPPATGVRVTIMPDPKAVHLIVKEVHQVARCYPLFDVAATLLHKRERCLAVFELKSNLPPMLRAKSGDALYLTREDAQAHLWHGEPRTVYLEEETIDVDPPSGNFQAVAKCGLSGKWLGPPNFHTYQTQLHRLHRERFAHMSFEAYSSKVQTERGEEAVNAWLETMTKKTRWRAKGQEGDEGWTDDITQAQRLLQQLAFDEVFEETHRAELPASASGHQLSAPLRVSLKLAFNHARKHAAMLIPTICKALEADHLPVFKRKGKLFTGPVRPHPLPAGVALAPRPAQMVEWIRANTPGAKLEGLWQAVLPEGSTAPPADYAADLFWLLQQGHILLFTDDTLMVQEPRPPQEPKKPKAEPKTAAEKTEAPQQTPAQEPKAEETAIESPPESVEEETTAEDASETETAAEAIADPAVEQETEPEAPPEAEATDLATEAAPGEIPAEQADKPQQ